MIDLESKSILVTGGSGGIGHEACLVAAEAGASVTVVDIDETGGRQSVERGGKAQFVKCDVTDEAKVENSVAMAVKSFGRLDGAFNNASIAQRSKPLHEVTREECVRCLEINVVGTFLFMKHELIAMMQTGGGSIVNTASIAGTIAYPFAAEYIVSKHGVLGLTKSAALEYSRRGVRTNTILPAATLTPMIQEAFDGNPDLEKYCIEQQPIGRLATAKEVAATAVWLMSDLASFVTGACLPVDGGYTAR
ncbi:MAG: oxidoreductase [Leifsonia xyli]|nr:MAG: oxidoreductase [Leifsonia xyli]